MYKLLFILFALQATAVCMGQVDLRIIIEDVNGNPISNVWIEVIDDEIYTESDAEGRAQLSLLPGEKRFNLSHLGFEKIDTTVMVSRSGSIQFQMTEVSYLFDEVELISTWVKDRTPITYSNYDKEYIQKNNQGQDMPFLLQWTPSAVVSSDAGAGIGYTGISIRGSDPTRINVTINGVPLNDSESQGVFWVNLPDFASSVDNIQIQRGAGSSTNGAGAFGATINLSTNKIHTKAHGSVSATLGSFATRRYNVLAGTGLINGKFTVDARISSILSDGYVDRARSNLRSVQVSAAYLGDKSSLKFNVFSGAEITYQAWNGLPFQYSDDPTLRTYNISGARSDGSFYDNQVDNYNQTHYQLIHQYNPMDRLFTNFTLHYTRGYGYYEEFRENDRLSNYRIDPIVIENTEITRTDLIRRRWLDNHFYGGIFSVDYYTQDKRDQITFGVAYNEYLGDHFGEIVWAQYAGESEYLDQYYFNAAKKTDFNTFIKYNRDLNRYFNIYADVQYRKIGYTYLGDNNAGWMFDGSANFDFFNPKVGLFFRDLKGGEAYLSVATAAREPNRRDFTDTSEGNNPKPEFMYNPELGFKKTGRFYSISTNFYLMYYKDQLAVTGEINDVGASIRTNIEDSYRTGIELEAALHHQGFFVGTALTLSRNIALEFIEKVDNWDTGEQLEIRHRNTDLALSPNTIANFELGYRASNLTLFRLNSSPEISLLTKYVGSQYLDNTSNENAKLDAYTFSDLRIRCPINLGRKQKLTVSFWLNNIFDAQYFTTGWIYRFQSNGYNPLPDDVYSRREGEGRYNLTGLFPQAGRNWLLGLQYEF